MFRDGKLYNSVGFIIRAHKNKAKMKSNCGNLWDIWYKMPKIKKGGVVRRNA